MSSTLIYLITGALNTLCIARVFRHNAAERVPFQREVAAYIAFYAVTSAVYLLFGIPMLNMLLNNFNFALMVSSSWSSLI